MVSQSAKRLEQYGLVERFRLNDNKKSVILRPTEKGQKLFDNYINETSSPLFDKYFSKLSALTDEQLRIVEEALYALDSDLEDSSVKVLSRIEG